MTNDNNAIGIIKIQKVNEGYYLRIPNEAARVMILKKGMMMRAFVSRDKLSIRYVKQENPDDIIELPDAPVRPVQHVQEQLDPVSRHISIMQRILGK